MITYQLEKFSSIQVEAANLFVNHWHEIAIDKDKVPLHPDWTKYSVLEHSDMLFCLTVRDGKLIVGYFIAFLLPHPHYSQSGTMAFTDVYYIRPDYRVGGTGVVMLIEAERLMKEKGVTKAYLSCKVHQDHTELFTKLGWNLTDLSFTKIFTE